MNIKKTNPIGIGIIENNSFKYLPEQISKDIQELGMINNKKFSDIKNGKDAKKMIRLKALDFNRRSKVLRLSKNTFENCKKIKLESLKENLRSSDFDFKSLTVLLPKDKDGIIRIERTGSDFDFLYLKNLHNARDVFFDTYSFLTGEFNLQKQGEQKEESGLVLKILAYLYYGEITTKKIKRKSRAELKSFTHFLNNSKTDITYVDSLWKKRIRTDGFNVSGHFRLQPFGEKSQKRKLIWIEEFSKKGYNRKATREMQ